MELITAIPATVRLLLVFALILLAIRRKLSLGSVFLCAALILGFVFQSEPTLMLSSLGHTLSDPKNLSLAVVVTLILILSSSMETSGQMQRMLDAFQKRVSNPVLSLTLFPALIGLLPMPGGAVFSAPMIREQGRRLGLSGAELSFTNYWFRHIWEYWWPLYPGILLTITLADVGMGEFIRHLWWLTPLAVFIGCVVLRRRLPRQESVPADPKTDASWKPFFFELTPVLVVIIGGLGGGLLLARLLPGSDCAVELGLIAALLCAVPLVWRRNHFTLPGIRDMLLRPALLRMVYMILGILAFKGMLADTGAVLLISDELARLHIPLMGICILLPFFVGLVTGITIAFVGTTFPILVPLIHALGTPDALMPTLMLALVSGFAGVLLSPLHLCLLLTCEYFKTELEKVLKLLLIPSLSLVAVGALAYWLLQISL